MHSALFVATMPNDHHYWGEYVAFVESRVKPPTAGVQRLAENVWLLNLQEAGAVAMLGHLIAFAETRKVAYGILPLEREPVWLPAGHNPTPT